jgi:hypothetical protein
MNLSTQTLPVENVLTLPVGYVNLATSPNGQTYVCNFSHDEIYEAPEAHEGWSFFTLFNHVSSAVVIPANAELKQAKDELGNIYICVE